MPIGPRKSDNNVCPICSSPVNSERHGPQCAVDSSGVVEVRPPAVAERDERAFDEEEDEFLPLLSAAHEFKTPLVVMLGYTELLRSGCAGEVNDRQRGILGEIQESAERLQRVVHDLLLLYGLRAAQGRGAGKPDQTVADVNANMKELFENWVPVANQKSIRYEFCPAQGEPRVKMEPLRLQHIVSNLIENALNYTPSGGTVTLSVRQCFWDRRKTQIGSLFSLERRVNRKIENAVCINVSDTGPGIHPDHHQEIFADFVQLPGASARGTGLGLAIARRLVDAHRGMIWVESELGKGSKFLVLLSRSR